MKNLLIDRVGLVVENYEEELKAMVCEHEWELFSCYFAPTSPDQDEVGYEEEGCVKCNKTVSEIEEELNTIGLNNLFIN